MYLIYIYIHIYIYIYIYQLIRLEGAGIRVDAPSLRFGRVGLRRPRELLCLCGRHGNR